MKHREHDAQTALIKWWKFAARGFGCDERQLFAIPNGGARNAITGARLKAEGVRAGVPDLFLAAPGRAHRRVCAGSAMPGPLLRCNGLFIEMKAGKNKQTEEQCIFSSVLQKAGYACFVCYSASEAVDVIESYLRPQMIETENTKTRLSLTVKA